MFRYARAFAQHPRVREGAWDRVRVAGSKDRLDRSLVDVASKILNAPFDPSRYLLTHATIVASVDTVDVPNVRVGKTTENGRVVNRKTSKYRVSAETDKYINNNHDAWSREVLLKSYGTFIGGHNFLEHVQVEDLSKGRIIDAVARDIGDSVYVDILIATDRKHSELIRDIESGKLSTLSMGCFLPGTRVSLADGTRIAIEDVQPGDRVLTHLGRSREVLNKQIRGGRWSVRKIEAVGVPSTITATEVHPFFVRRSDGHLEEVLAKDLKVGDLLSFPGGESSTPITSIEAGTYEGWVHDMEVEEDHSYVVEGVAVHNCSIDGSVCTKCGNWAADETEMCEHIRFAKGNVFYDESGQRQRIAELCGDESLDPTGGVTFIEASWVEVPAFRGAVARNVISLSSNDTSRTAQQLASVVSTLPPKVDRSGRAKAAAFEGSEEPAEDTPSEEAPAKPSGPAGFSDLEESIRNQILENVRTRLQNDLAGGSKDSAGANDSVVHSAALRRARKAAKSQMYAAAVRTLLASSETDFGFIRRLARLNREAGVFLPDSVYTTPLRVGALGKFRTVEEYLGACARISGARFSGSEKKTLVRLGTLLRTFQRRRRAEAKKG